MIVTHKNWLSLVFAFRGSTLVHIWPRVIFVLVLSVIVEYLSATEYLTFSMTPVPFTVVGLALAIFLGFRNNAAYDRYWEGRKLWGGLVNVTRNFGLQTRLIRSDAEAATSRSELIKLILAYVNCLRHQLRSGAPDAELRKYLNDKTEIEKVRSNDNVPLAVLDIATQRLMNEWQEGRIESYHLTALQRDLSRMLDMQGACERIHSTPVPFTYSVLTHRTVLLYCLALPFGLHDTVGWAMPVVTTFIAYAFLGLDDLGDEIEQPFGEESNSLPLSAICRTIEINLLQLIDHDHPDPIRPVDDVLL